MFSRLGRLFSASTPPQGKNAESNNTFPPSFISLGNSCTYRYDSRGPEIIKVQGFVGTISRDNTEFRVFGDNTIFASRTKKGAKAFLKTRTFTGQKNFQYLYQINILGRRSFSFVENYNRDKNALVEAILSSLPAELLAGMSVDEARSLAHNALIRDFNSVDEIQIEGPIQGQRISHIATTLV
ncbi:hypothetical protein J1781_22360 [Rahnella sp. C60]|uniref:Uncharacterized protein n=1 Tax=Rahnella perminowiae TaxID=2816244 RepID=A0ABS6L2R3_9GAMM|nr:hypothetical protein [Rahnella perminowiae]MBU9810068.1 hypothetical protein [Rahnella perminowiae]MBU9817576.1 hypothetical protein [Rahnella perminowiae]MBU9828344.1 hypothetical protein [Rahnella perminowiae]MBU9836131.1 hypothetical protein [Rahnella perminowiae]MCR9001385.1 hypothetical protein [Rahnella perminowiae]